MKRFNVLYEDNHLLVLNKPADLATMGAQSGPTLHSLAVDYLREKYNKPGRVFLGVVSRLDAMTTGAIVMPRTSKAASRLSPQFLPSKKQTPAPKQPTLAGTGATKIYLAMIRGHLEKSTGMLADHVAKDDRARRMRLVSPRQDGALEAKLRYLVINQTKHESVVAIELLTGRKHQIRVQFADRGYCLLGDRKYGSTDPFPSGISLHSWKLRINHPTLKHRMEFSAELPRSWRTTPDSFGNRSKKEQDDTWKQIQKAFSLPTL